jgi:hypothetical protein
MQGCCYTSPLFPDLQPHLVELAVASIAIRAIVARENAERNYTSQMTLFLDVSCDSLQQTRLGQRRVVRAGR